jgi:hypothetical protein
MIRMLDHTADVGFEVVEVSSVEALFDEARQALLMTVFEEPPEEGERGAAATVRPRPRDPLGALDQRARLLYPERRICPGECGPPDPGG